MLDMPVVVISLIAMLGIQMADAMQGNRVPPGLKVLTRQAMAIDSQGYFDGEGNHVQSPALGKSALSLVKIDSDGELDREAPEDMSEQEHTELRGGQELNASRMAEPSDRAFPGAMGPGTDTPGGRFGKLLVVTNLKDDGKEGSLRWAVEQDYPRFIVFEVGGVINLEEEFEISNSFVTIAGHSAPPPGITLAGHRVKLKASDSVTRFLRMRMGEHRCTRAKYIEDRGCKCLDADVMGIEGSSDNPPKRIVVDHVSAAWGTDEGVSPKRVSAMTISNSLITQALHNSCHEERGEVENHGFGTLATYWTRGSQVGMHGNLWTQSRSRTPKIGGGCGEDIGCNGATIHFVNNLIHDGHAYGDDDGLKSNWVGNTREYSEKKILNDDEEDNDDNIVVTRRRTKYFSSGSNDKFYAPDGDYGNREKSGAGKDRGWDPRGLTKQSDLFGDLLYKIVEIDGEDEKINHEKFTLGGKGWPIFAQETRVAYDRVMEEAGVFALRDRVDKESIKAIGDSKQLKIDSPGGCCVKSDDCRGGVKVADKVKSDDCKLTSCSTKYFEGSSECEEGDASGMFDDAVDQLNTDLPEKSGVDWDDEYGCSSDCNFAALEDYLESCLHPYMDGTTKKCTHSGATQITDGLKIEAGTSDDDEDEVDEDRRRRRKSDDGDEDRRRRSKSDDDEVDEDRRRRRSKSDDDEVDEDRRRRRKSDDDEDEVDEDRRRRRKSDDEDEVDEDRRRRRKSDDVDEDRRRRKSDDGDEDRRRRKSDDGDEDRRRRKSDDVDEDRRRKSDEDRRRKSDEDRRRKSDEDRRRKSDEDRRRKSDEDRRRKSDEDRRRKSDEDRRRKSDEDRRRKSDEDRRRKSDEDRRRKSSSRRRKSSLMESTLQTQAPLSAVVVDKGGDTEGGGADTNTISIGQ